MKKKIFLISLILLLLISISAASAADNTTTTKINDHTPTTDMKHDDTTKTDKKTSDDTDKKTSDKTDKKTSDKTDKKAEGKTKKTKTTPKKTKNVDGYKTYEELKKALENCKDGDTIKIAANIKILDTLKILKNNIIIDGQGFTINGDGNRIFEITGNNVLLKNLKLTNGDSAEGGAIYSKADKLSVENCEFTSNHARARGGAIYAEGSLSCVNCIFKNNHAPNDAGGAIWVKKTLNCDKCTFDGNSAQNGGAIYIYNDEGKSVIKNSIFTNNKASGFDGGAVCRNENLLVRNCTFAGNIADVAGGAIYAKKRLTVESSTFRNNKAYGANVYQCDGGAIYCGNIDCNNCVFENNFADDYGGAIYINDEGKSSIKNSKFINNKAQDNDGGAIYLDGVSSYISIIHNIFQGNTAGSGEGSIVYTYGYFEEISKNYYGVENPDWSSHLLYEHCYWGSNVDHKDSNYARTIDEYYDMGDFELNNPQPISKIINNQIKFIDTKHLIILDKIAN